MDRKLLLAILKTHDYSFDAEAVAKDLSTDGETLTSNAIRKRIKRIREMVKGVPDTKRYACAKLIILLAALMKPYLGNLMTMRRARKQLVIHANVE